MGVGGCLGGYDQNSGVISFFVVDCSFANFFFLSLDRKKQKKHLSGFCVTFDEGRCFCFILLVPINRSWQKKKKKIKNEKDISKHDVSVHI